MHSPQKCIYFGSLICDVLAVQRNTVLIVDRYLLISIGANACSLVVLRAVHVRAVVKGSVSPSNGSPTSLVEKMPMKAGKGSVLSALVLEEQRALLCPELL